MELKELKEAVKKDPIKKAVNFEQLYDVVVEVAAKGQVATLKMLKQVYEAYEEQNPKIADEFFDILKNSLARENGDISAYVHIPAAGKRIIEDCYFGMIGNKNESQKIMDRYTKKTLDDFNENDPRTFSKGN